MENFLICSRCSVYRAKALWICKCSNINLCEKHLGEHSVEHYYKNTQLELIEVGFRLSAIEKEKLKVIVKLRLKEIKEHKHFIATETMNYIKQIMMLHEEAIYKLNSIKAEYCKFINEEILSEKEKDKVKELKNNKMHLLRFQKPLKVSNKVGTTNIPKSSKSCCYFFVFRQEVQ